jgi:hypothetical protein
MSSTTLWNSPNELVQISNSFAVNGVPTDPTTVSVIVIDPTGNSTSYTYDPGTITRSGTGDYDLEVACSPSVVGSYGLWNFVWTGTGTASDVSHGTFRTFALTDAVTGAPSWYCGMEELKSRLSSPSKPLGDSFDYEITMAIATASLAVTRYCGQHFYQVAETRTFTYDNIYEFDIDPLVSLTAFNLDYNGTFDYNTAWTQDVNFQLIQAKDSYNANDYGVPRPYTHVQVVGQGSGGITQFLPFIWPFTNKNRVQITGTWGWAVVPMNVTMATLIFATDIFKLKDAPFGVDGFGDMSMRVSSNPLIVELLKDFVNENEKSGV